MVEHLHIATERAGTKRDVWHATAFQSSDAGTTSRPRRDTAVLHFGTTSFRTAGAHMQTLTDKLHTTWYGIQQQLHALATHPVKCRTSQCTIVQRRVTCLLCSHVQQATPDHTQPCCWLWSVVQQTWTFQPIEVSATVLAPYLVQCGVAHSTI